MATLQELTHNTDVLKITNNPLKCIEIYWDSSDPLPDLSNCVNLETFEINNLTFNHPLPDLSNCLKLKLFIITSNIFTHQLPDLSKCSILQYFELSCINFNDSLPDLSKCFELYSFKLLSNKFNHGIPDLFKCSSLKYFEFHCVNSTALICDFRCVELWSYRALSQRIAIEKDINHKINIAEYNDFIGRKTKTLYDEYESEEIITKRIEEAIKQINEERDEIITKRIEEAIEEHNEEREEEERFNKIHQSIKERDYETQIEKLEDTIQETREELGNKIEKLEQNVADLFKIIEELRHPKSFYM